ncbi:methyl-accepting chemotaxis protein [Devosia sp.]|uniref:methyl-accepting chemotaxis protein n=1 Tax=Devosia sp. TaxID=1871048 RepID=UPI003265E7CE
MGRQHDLQGRLDFIGLDEAALQRLESVQVHVDKHLPLALDKFYAKISRIPVVARFFDGKPQMDRAQSKQIGHWKAIAAGQFDDDYFAASTRVGLRHAQIGLEPRWHIGGYGIIFETLVRGLIHDATADALQSTPSRFGRKPPKPTAVLASADAMAAALSDVLKSMLLDIDIGVTAYFDKLSSEAKAADDAAKERINRAVTLTGDVLKDMAEGDLTSRITAEFEPEFTQIKEDTNAVADKLSGIVSQLQRTSRSLKTATGEILSGSNDLADRTTRQAATIEETSAAIEQLSLAVVENARRAVTASEKAQTVSVRATEGGAVMSEANAAMTAIEMSSGKISSIIGLIDDIAFQTNLLALNASVEAARAGDAGNGFAVVAVEVRRLAQSAAQASSEIKTLIEVSAGEVRNGSKLVSQAAETLVDILAGAQESAGLIDSIAQANREQSSALEEVSVAVRQLDEMTQHNAALVEQTNAAIEQTEAQASELDQIVDVFRIDAIMEPPASPRTPVKPIKPAKSAQRVMGNTALAKDWNEF